ADHRALALGVGPLELDLHLREDQLLLPGAIQKTPDRADDERGQREGHGGLPVERGALLRLGLLRGFLALSRRGRRRCAGALRRPVLLGRRGPRPVPGVLAIADPVAAAARGLALAPRENAVLLALRVVDERDLEREVEETTVDE